MKAGDRVRVKQWQGELNELSFNEIYPSKDYIYIQKSSTGNIEVKCDSNLTWYFPEEAVYLVDEQKPNLQIVKDAFLGKAVFQGYSSDTIADDKFFTLTEGILTASGNESMYYHEDLIYLGTLMDEGELTAITVEDYVRQKYKPGDIVVCISNGRIANISGHYTVLWNEEEQLIDIEIARPLGTFRVRVFDNGRWADKVGDIQSVTFGPYNSKPTEFAESLARAVQHPMTVEQAYDAGYVQAAPNEDPCVIKTKKSKGLDVNIKSSKFVIPKIK